MDGIRIVPIWQRSGDCKPFAIIDPKSHEQRIQAHERRVSELFGEEFRSRPGPRLLTNGAGSGGARKRRECWCAETGRYFRSMGKAAASAGVSVAAIVGAIQSGTRVKGKHWTDRKPK